jgi:hypothetical protein
VPRREGKGALRPLLGRPKKEPRVGLREEQETGQLEWASGGAGQKLRGGREIKVFSFKKNHFAFSILEDFEFLFNFNQNHSS